MKYTKYQLGEMREKLAEVDCEVMDEEAIFLVSLDGCKGWNNTPDDEVIEDFEAMFGEDYYDDELDIPSECP